MHWYWGDPGLQANGSTLGLCVCRFLCPISFVEKFTASPLGFNPPSDSLRKAFLSLYLKTPFSLCPPRTYIHTYTHPHTQNHWLSQYTVLLHNTTYCMKSCLFPFLFSI